MEEQEIKMKYENMANKVSPKSKIFQDCIKAFLVGGLICDIGQFVHNITVKFGLPEDQVGGDCYNYNDFFGSIINGNRDI